MVLGAAGGPHGDGDKGVTVLAARVGSWLPVEVHGLALEGLKESAGDFPHFTRLAGGVSLHGRGD